MPVKTAVNAYRNQRLNCAQSVLEAFRSQVGLSRQDVQDARALGSGLAEGGRCGALHAALRILEDPQDREAVRRAFAERAGSEQCLEIRQIRRLSCVGCVELAATLLQDLVGSGGDPGTGQAA